MRNKLNSINCRTRRDKTHSSLSHFLHIIDPYNAPAKERTARSPHDQNPSCIAHVRPAGGNKPRQKTVVYACSSCVALHERFVNTHHPRPNRFISRFKQAPVVLFELGQAGLVHRSPAVGPGRAVWSLIVELAPEGPSAGRRLFKRRGCFSGGCFSGGCLKL